MRYLNFLIFFLLGMRLHARSGEFVLFWIWWRVRDADDLLFRILRRFAVGVDATRDAEWIAKCATTGSWTVLFHSPRSPRLEA